MLRCLASLAALTVAGIAGCAQSSLETEVAAVGASYFVDSQSGNDAQAGTSTDRPWRTLERLGSVKLQPGDSVFLRRGSTWRGTFRPAQSGSPGRPIRIAAYGEGPRPVVDGGPQNAVLLENVQHWSVEGLELTNDRGSGQDVLRARSSKKSSRDSSIAVLDCLVRDGGGSGIHVGENEEGNFDNVVVEGCRAVSNKVSGIFVQGSYFDRVAGVTIRKCVARGNGADGIKIYNARKGLIEECLAEGNGWNEDARVGIWCWNSDDVLIQLCESFGNRTPGTQDGGGFDIDWACSNCVIQHCYSHDNEGAGYLLMGAGDPG
ncbi:MAG TPA: right-handed parallel beta-helix repeat-containing protein, partial [Planctomycetota bacterium]|nr:right-handed parallel beta-helix repeat-containing protein [Planctomycetota bacterium]